MTDHSRADVTGQSRRRQPGYDAAMPDSATLPLREAGRVIVLDPAGQVLLFRYEDAPPNGTHWSTPGGGLNPGEDFLAGARRELAEETGWTDVPLGPRVFEQTIVMDYAGRMVRQHEVFFTARVGVTRRELGDVSAMHHSDGIAAARWWTAAEIDASTQDIWPAGLADLVRGLAGGVAPGELIP
jgi:ADP-ribose pyrophosphatase YjhB (NUDIX family)